MRRREFLIGALGIFCAPVRAQTIGRARVGWLSGGSIGKIDIFVIIKGDLRELDWTNERLETVERRAEGNSSVLPRLASEIVAYRPDVIACTGVNEARALQGATREIPIVFTQVAIDPVAAGLVQSIARPGGNVTGMLQGPQLLSGKRLQILAEFLGHPLRRLAYVSNPKSVSSGSLWADALGAATQTGAEIIRADVVSPGDLDRVFEEVKDRDAVLVQYDFLLSSLRSQIAELAARHRLPTMYENRTHVEVGGLVSFGADLRENYRQGAIYIDRILRGAPVSELPVIQASRFELVLNTGAARALALTIPPALLARADEVIE